MVLLNIAGGIALILFATRFLRKGLDRLFGQRMVHWLQRLTKRPLAAFGAGVVTGAVTPSSTAVSLVAVQMLTAGQLSAERMLAVFLGANVGITILAQLLVFHVQDYAPLFLVGGIIGFQFLKRNSFRGVGQCLLAMGFMFFGMKLIGDASKSISPTGELGLFLSLVASHAEMVLIIGALAALVLQSSTAAMGLAIGLAATGLFSQTAMLSWVLGANIGIALTTMAAGWNSLEGRRLAGANLLVKVSAVAIAFMILPRFVETGVIPSKQLVSQSIQFHTGFNLVVGLLALPLVPFLSRLMRALVAPAPVETLQAPRSYLDVNALDSPALALTNATREVLTLADEVKVMLCNFWQAQEKHDRTLAAIVHAHDDQVDDTAAAVTEYLSRISQESLSAQESHWQFSLLSCANELESIADIIDKNLCDFVRKQAGHGFPMTSQDEHVLQAAYKRILTRCDLTISLITTRDAVSAAALIQDEDRLDEWCRHEQRSHYERLRSGGEAELQSSVYFLDMLGSFRRISSHLSSIAYAIVPEGDTLNPNGVVVNQESAASEAPVPLPSRAYAVQQARAA